MRHLLSTLFVTVSVSSAPANAEEISLLEATDLTWERTAEGVSFAPLHGDRFRGSYQAFVELPAGTVSPPHVKSASMSGVMLQGEMIHYVSHENPGNARKIGPGSFYRIPGGLAHVSACVSDGPCIAYLYQDGPFDFLPVQQ